MFKYAIYTSYEELESALSQLKNNINNEELKKELEFRLGTYLHWILDAHERCSIEHSAFFSGLRFANNNLKHSLELKKITERKGGFCFPICFWGFKYRESEFQVQKAI